MVRIFLILTGKRRVIRYNGQSNGEENFDPCTIFEFFLRRHPFFRSRGLNKSPILGAEFSGHGERFQPAAPALPGAAQARVFFQILHVQAGQRRALRQENPRRTYRRKLRRPAQEFIPPGPTTSSLLDRFHFQFSFIFSAQN